MNLKESAGFGPARLTLNAIQAVGDETVFALTGGSAINYFLREMPRLSVDLALIYLLIEDKEATLVNINSALLRIAGKLKKANPSFQVQMPPLPNTNKLSNRLFVTSGEMKIKIEASLVHRGTVFPIKRHSLSKGIQTFFKASGTIQLLSPAEIYGGKLCAAINRQHPRDLFDVKPLMEPGALTEEIRKGFILALISHDRPLSELLTYRKDDITTLFKTQFHGLTPEPVLIEELQEVQSKLLSMLLSSLQPNEKEFLLQFTDGKLMIQLLGLEGIGNLPAIQGNLIRIKAQKPESRKAEMTRLKKAFTEPIFAI